MSFRYRGYKIDVPILVYTRLTDLVVEPAEGATFPIVIDGAATWIDRQNDSAGVVASQVVVTATFQAASDPSKTMSRVIPFARVNAVNFLTGQTLDMSQFSRVVSPDRRGYLKDPSDTVETTGPSANNPFPIAASTAYADNPMWWGFFYFQDYFATAQFRNNNRERNLRLIFQFTPFGQSSSYPGIVAGRTRNANIPVFVQNF